MFLCKFMDFIFISSRNSQERRLQVMKYRKYWPNSRGLLKYRGHWWEALLFKDLHFPMSPLQEELIGWDGGNGWQPRPCKMFQIKCCCSDVSQTAEQCTRGTHEGAVVGSNVSLLLQKLMWVVRNRSSGKIRWFYCRAPRGKKTPTLTVAVDNVCNLTR